MQEPVTIIGAGLGGLTLACILRRHAIPVIVYEGEASPEARAQGGLLDIHVDGGQRALADAGLLEQFRRLVRPGEDAKRVVDKHGSVLLDRPGNAASARPEVDRGELRQLLIASLSEDTIRWGHKVTAAMPLGEGQYRVAFADGVEVATRLLVGADGGWSRVRPLVSDVRPAYTGTCFIEAQISARDPCAAAAAGVTGRGTLMAVAPGQGILAHRNADGSIHLYVALNRPETWVAALDPGNTGATLAEAAKAFDDWTPTLRALVTGNAAASLIRPIHALPVGERWRRVPGITLLGDAAHLMSPFAGEGANLAMQDGADLARALAAHPGDSEGALAAYERDMFPRAVRSAEQSARNMARFFGPDAPASVAELFAG